ncbi:MAG: ABC transporter ATP-binding protein [Lachnospiraceae bacterium]|jgi:ATP-binding cassette subfamily B multidrug efflux pump|nr:ABC transporter ATP-binding protein [Lachnospiraceae bacterium]
MGKLLRYLQGYKRESILGPLFKLLEAGFELFVPLVMADIIDIGIQNKDLPYIWKMGGILVALGGIGLICSITAQYFAAKAAVGFGTKLRKDLFAHIMKLSYTEIDTIGSSTFITRMTSDINQVQSGVNLVLRLFLRSPFIVFGAMVMAFTIDRKSALVFVVAIPLLSMVVFGILFVSMPLYKKVQKQLDLVLRTTRENLTGARVIRAFHKEKEEIEGFEKDSDLLSKLQIFVGKISALLNPITYILIQGAVIALVWIGGKQVYYGSITQGEVIALINYMSQILVELVKLANLMITISKSLACGNRISSVLEMSTSITEMEEELLENHKNDQVEFKDVDFYYKGGKAPALEGISLKVKKGETIGMIGGTGAGKTSLVNLIPRFYESSKGSVFVDGNNVRVYSIKKLREKIGIVPQKAVLFQGTVRENMQWGKKDAKDEEIWKALEIAQAKTVIEEKGQGLDFMILQGGKNLSGGQRQRLTIARALVKKPEILILDDSASALDYATDAKLRKAIRENGKKMTVFLVSQRVSTVISADRILVLDDGKIAGLGSHEELLKSCEVYKEICLSQLSTKEV